MRNSRRVVVTGLGVVAPNGIGKETFWQNLILGKSAIDYITAFDASAYPCRIAGQVQDFVATDFMRGRTAKTTGRFTQLGVASARLALDDAKLSISPTLSAQAFACFGNSANGIGDIAADAIDGLTNRGVSAVKPWSALEFPPHAVASHLAIEFGIRGQAVTISSNCCTGLDAIETARAHIASGHSTVALAGSGDAPIFPASFSAFCALGALSKRSDAPEKASRPYDLLRDGLVISEGAATLVLEDYDFARDRGATIYAEVLGFQAGSEAIGMRKGDLSGKVMADAIRGAIARSGLSLADIDYINAHGSSLADYDICDSNAFKNALGKHAYHIPITSIKSMIGQPVSAAGTLQTASACMSLQTQCAPPTINQEVPDPQCDLDYVPNLARVARIKHVLINAHSFGGSVSALVIASPTRPN
jgi:3-oxoacyl-[acyl-carrier-protein] synthase II